MANRIIHNLSELCEFFSADRPSDLNRRIYKGTDCGAHISVYTGHPGNEVEQQWQIRIVHREDGTLTASARPVHAFCDPPATGAATTWRPIRHAPDEVRHYVQADPDGKHDRLDLDWDERETWEQCRPDGHDAMLCNVSITVQVGAVPWDAYYCGGDWSTLDAHPEIATGFIIGTIVEGSDAEVNGALMTFPVDANGVDNWITEMEAEADQLWHDANTCAEPRLP